MRTVRCYLLMLIVLAFLPVSSSALEFNPPEVPAHAAHYMPENTDSFADGILDILSVVLVHIQPELRDACKTGFSVICTCMLLSLTSIIRNKESLAVNLIGAICICTLLLGTTGTMIRLAEETIRQVLQYGKLLLPVMTAALSAQGGVTSASGLYLGTAFFGTLLGSILSELFIPLVYFQLALSMGLCASQESLLKKIRDMLKGAISWTLKTMLTVFTTYMGITGAVSGNVDKAAVKAAKLGISSAVPVVGGVLSEASEMILVSAGILKNTAGIYGIFALLSLFLEPFLRIGLQYLILKISAMICSVIGTKQLSDLVEDFAAAMGILLGITASAVLLSLISTVCFMNGVK